MFSSEKLLQWRRNKPDWIKRLYLAGIVILIAINAIILALSLEYLKFGRFSSSRSTCKAPRIRREWRALEDHEKKNYIGAVQCLQDLPSELKGKGALYDDFVYVHMFVGSLCSFPYFSINVTTTNKFQHMPPHPSSLGIEPSFTYTNRY